MPRLFTPPLPHTTLSALDLNQRPVQWWRAEEPCEQRVAVVRSEGGPREADENTETPVTKPSLGGRMGLRPFAMRTIGAAAAAVVLALGGMTASAFAAAPSEGDAQCLGCHGAAGLEKQLASGETLSLQIPGDAFAQSVHSVIGCTGCHTDIDPSKHPPAENPISGKRAFSIATVQVCKNCHSDEFEQWGKSVHAALVREGDPGAPLCTGCHSPHAVMKGASEAMDTVPCKACHGDIFTAYAASVHGVARSSGQTQAPLCFGCHGAHGVSVPSAGAGMRDVCLHCHTGALAAHREWLPNAELHFDVVSCPACHAPKAERRVDLILYDSTAQKEVSEPAGVPEFESRTGSGSATKPGLDATTLWTLLKTLNRPGVGDKTSLKGRLEVRTGVEAHELAGKSAAISDCNTCHRAGAQAFQSVTISVAGPAGIPVRYGASEKVLSSAFSIESIGGFYAIGGTRITFLDVLFVLALFGGIALPIGHLTLRWCFKWYLNRKPH